MAALQNVTNTGSAVVVSTNGSGNNAYVRFPLTPCFGAISSSSQGLSGSSAVAVNFGNLLFDQASNFTGSNTFTAPITGKYLFNFTINIPFAGTDEAWTLLLTTTTQTYTFNITLNTSANTTTSQSIIANMALGNTAIVQVNPNGHSNALGSGLQYFSGMLIA